MKKILYLFLLLGTTALYAQKNLLQGDTGAETRHADLTSGDTTWSAFGSFDWCYDRTTGYNSDRSIALFRSGLACLPYTVPLQAGKTYTFSFYAKADKDGVTGGINCYPAVVKEWPWPSVNNAKKFRLTTDWARYTFTFTPQKTESYFPVYLSFDHNTKINFDAFQLEEGNSATEYEPPQGDFVGIDLADAPGEIHYLGDDLKPVVSVVPAGKTGKVEVAVLNYLDKEVAKFSKDITDGTAKTVRWQLPFKPENTGWYRIQAKWNGKSTKRDFVVTTPLKLGKLPFASMCSMWMDLDIMQRLGGGMYAIAVNFNTCAAEPGKIHIPWKEKRYHVEAAKAAGQLVKVDIYFPPPPRLMSAEDKAAMKKYGLGPKRFLPEENAIEDWKKFISTLVNEYGQYIDIYEFGGEYDVQVGANPYYKARFPDASGHRIDGRPLELYAKFVSIAAEIIYAKDPTARITAVRPCDVDCRSNFYFSRGVYNRAKKGTFNSFGVDNYASPRRIGENEPDPGPVSDMIWQYKQALDVLQKTGSKSDYVFISEYGYDIWMKDIDRLPYRTQYASVMAQSMMIARAVGFKHMMYYSTYGRNNHPGVSVTYDLYFKHEPMVAIGTFCNMSRLLADVTESGHAQPAEGIVIVWFKRPDNSGFGAIWNAALKSETRIRIAPLTAKNMMGNNITLKQADGKMDFFVEHEPVIFEHKNFDELVKILKAAEVIPMSPVKEFARLTAPGKISINMRSKLKAKTVKGEITVGNTRKRFTANPYLFTPTYFECDAKPGSVVDYSIMPDNFPQPITGKFTIPSVHTIPKVAKALPLDGDLEKYKAIPSLYFASKNTIYPIDVFGWAGADDLNVKLHLAHDGKYLYIGAAVTDDYHCNPYSGGAVVSGDVLQIAIHPYTNTAENKYPLDTNFALGLTDKGVTTPVLYRGPDKHILNRNNCFAKRFEDKKITLYEIKLPLSSLKLNIADGQTFGLGAVVFDSDSGKRWDYYMNLYPGVTGNYSPERFGVFNFSTK